MEFPKIQKRGFELAQRKQISYGPKNISEFGLHGIVIRLNDKMERLKRLVFKSKAGFDESIEDTLMDVANYGVIGLMVKEGKWPD